MKNLHQTMHAAIIIFTGILLLIFIKAPSPEKQRSDYETSSKSVAMSKAPVNHFNSSKVLQVKRVTPGNTIDTNQSPTKRLTHFQELKGKVLLNHKENTEKEQLLSDPKIIEWVCSSLTKINGVRDFKERLSMIDFLENTVTWKDNPSHEQALRAISGVILSNTFSDAPRETKRQLVGDKIELFAILSEEAPEEAAALTSRVQGTKLEPILNYAARRLPVKQPKSEGR